MKVSEQVQGEDDSKRQHSKAGELAGVCGSVYQESDEIYFYL